MRKLALLAMVALTAMGTLLMAGTASAQYGDHQVEVRDAATQELCDSSLPGCELNLSGTMSIWLKNLTTGQMGGPVTCQVDAQASIIDDGRVSINTWDASPGNNQNCGVNQGGSAGWGEPCNGEPMTGSVIKPGTQWSTGDGFSIIIDDNACFSTGVAGGNWEMGTASFALSGDETISDALSWTMGQTLGMKSPTDYFGLVFAAELESDTELIITEL